MNVGASLIMKLGTLDAMELGTSLFPSPVGVNVGTIDSAGLVTSVGTELSVSLGIELGRFETIVPSAAVGTALGVTEMKGFGTLLGIELGVPDATELGKKVSPLVGVILGGLDTMGLGTLLRNTVGAVDSTGLGTAVLTAVGKSDDKMVGTSLGWIVVATVVGEKLGIQLGESDGGDTGKLVGSDPRQSTTSTTNSKHPVSPILQARSVYVHAFSVCVPISGLLALMDSPGRSP
jgi:hypothetical protein